MQKSSLIAFLSIVVIYFGALIGEFEFILHLTKPMLMISLGVWYWFATKAEVRSMLVIGALSFSMVGDSFLMYADQKGFYFEGGIASFLIAHLCYIFAYRQHRDPVGDESSASAGVQRFRMALPIVLAASGLVIVLYPKLGELRIPVLVYAATIAIMVLQALFRLHRTTSRSFVMVLTGAVLFMISDSMIAIDRFLNKIEFISYLVMSTYIAGQFLIVKGLVTHSMNNDN